MCWILSSHHEASRSPVSPWPRYDVAEIAAAIFAHIHANLRSDASQHASLQYRPHSDRDAQELPRSSCPRRGCRSTAERNAGKNAQPVPTAN